jgi:hypothetical protein
VGSQSLQKAGQGGGDGAGCGGSEAEFAAEGSYQSAFDRSGQGAA